MNFILDTCERMATALEIDCPVNRKRCLEYTSLGAVIEDCDDL
jgi:hypothetical protein